MMQRLIPFYLLLFLTNVSDASTYPVILGQQKVLIEVSEGLGEKTFVHLHQNETTALKAAKIVSQQQGAGLLTLKHAGGRTIKFTLNHQHYAFDPNRIFTDNGIKKTLQMYSHYTPKAHQAVKTLARDILKHLPQGKVIAVHNNRGYSLRDYLPGHSLERDAKSLHLSAKHYYRNFYLVTLVEDFTRFKKQDLNSILQADNALDDGSLSVLLGKKSYVNVEAGYDQLAEQVRMLELA